MAANTERRVSTVNSNKQIILKLEILDKNVNELKTAFLGNVDEDRPGLLERVRKLEEWVASEKKLVYLITGIIIADIVTRLWALIVK